MKKPEKKKNGKDLVSIGKGLPLGGVTMMVLIVGAVQT